MLTVGIIPARAGSKRVPGKNLRLLAGKPLVSYTIEAALDSKLDRVIVSTEDKKTASVAKKFGADVPFLRPKKLATDTASSISAIFHTLGYLEKEEGYFPNIIAFLQPTSPLRTSKHIDAGLKMIQKSNVDSVVSVCAVDPIFHPYYVYRLDKKNNLREIIKRAKKPLRSQDLPKFYGLTDALIIVRRRYFDKAGDPAPCFNTKSVKGIVMDRISSMGIDDESDIYWRSM